MSESRTDDAYTTDFGEVMAAEEQWHVQRREVESIDPEAPTVGVALSGGGIRSATFNLGILNSLDRHGVMKQADYLSTVSGGGYIGACYSWLINRRLKSNSVSSDEPVFSTAVRDERTDVLGWLRAHGKYLVSEPGFSGWTLGSSILASTLLNLLVFLPIVLLVFAAMSLDVFSMFWPAHVNLPGAQAIAGHDGFALLLLAGVGCFALYALLVLKYAAVSGVKALRSTRNVLRVRRWMGLSLQLGAVFVVTGLIPVVALMDEALLGKFQSAFLKDFGGHLTYLTPLLGGSLATWRSVRVANSSGKNTGKLAIAGLGLLLYGAAMFAYHLVMHTALLASTGFFVALALSLVLGLFCDPNWVSMHSYYRARIASAFMPHVSDVAASEDDRSFDYALHDMSPLSGAPLHIINTTLNTLSSPVYKWRSREGASFSLTALYSGSPLTGFRRTDTYMDQGVALSTAATISGAAVDPNNSIVKSRAVSVLMSLLNCRLGFWAENPRLKGKKRFGADWYSLVGREVLGVGLNETSQHVHLSDGGQFENLGVYELVRRKCRYIISSDAGADPEYALSDLARVIDLVKADFGAQIDISAEALLDQQRSQKGFCPCAVGSIRYADGSKGELLFLKSMTFEHLPANIYSYAHQNALFPNESTANQFYGEAQFDAYETLGRTLVDRLIGSDEAVSVEALFARAKERVAGVTADSPVTGERRRPGSPMRGGTLEKEGVAQDSELSKTA